MKSRRLAVASACLLGLAYASSPVMAHDAEGYGRDGLYAFGGVGKTFVSWDLKGTALAKKDKDESANAWRLGVGYRFNDYLGVEVQHVGMAEVVKRQQAGHFKANGNAVGVVGFLPLGQRFELFGKLQAMRASNTYRAPAGISPFANTSEDVTKLSAGIGANFYVTERLAIRAEVDGLTKQSKSARRKSGAGDIKGGTATVGLAYTF